MSKEIPILEKEPVKAKTERAKEPVPEYSWSDRFTRGDILKMHPEIPFYEKLKEYMGSAEILHRRVSEALSGLETIRDRDVTQNEVGQIFAYITPMIDSVVALAELSSLSKRPEDGRYLLGQMKALEAHLERMEHYSFLKKVSTNARESLAINFRKLKGMLGIARAKLPLEAPAA